MYQNLKKRAFGHAIKSGSKAHRSPFPPFLPSAMSLDEQQQTVRSLSGTASVWSHSSVDQSSGASTPAVTAFSTLRRPSGSATMSNVNNNGNEGAQHHPSHVYVHRQAQSQAQQNLAASQNQSAMSTTADVRNGNIAFSDGSRGSQPALLRAQGVRKFGPAAIPIVRPSPSSQATVGAIGDGRRRVLGVSLIFHFLSGDSAVFSPTVRGSKSYFCFRHAFGYFHQTGRDFTRQSCTPFRKF